MGALGRSEADAFAELENVKEENVETELPNELEALEDEIKAIKTAYIEKGKQWRKTSAQENRRWTRLSVRRIRPKNKQPYLY